MLEDDEGWRLRRALQRAWCAAAALYAIPLILAGLVAALVLGTGDLARGPAWLLAALCLGWMWLLRGAPARVRALRGDRADAAVASVEGQATLALRRGIGLLAPSRWSLLVAGEAFDATGFALAGLYPGCAVRVRVGARSRVLLSVRALAEAPAAARQTGLGERERQLLALLVEGLSDKLIARRLDLAPGTVRTYNSALFKKLGVADRDAAVAWAREPGNAASIDVD